MREREFGVAYLRERGRVRLRERLSRIESPRNRVAERDRDTFNSDVAVLEGKLIQSQKKTDSITFILNQ